MRLQFLGTGGYHPNTRRHTACLLLPEIGVALDAGSSFFRLPERLPTRDLHVFLTHAHLDHICGLTYPLVPLLNGQIQRAVVYSAPVYLDAVQQHLFAQPLFPLLPNYEWTPLTDRVTLPDGSVLTHCPLVHPGGSLGYRIDWPDRSLAYITDTTASDDYLDFIRGVDVLVHECYFRDDQAQMAITTGHSCISPVAELAAKANVGRLLLTHIDPQHAEDDPLGIATAQAIFPNTQIAEDLLEINF